MHVTVFKPRYKQGVWVEELLNEGVLGNGKSPL